MKGGVVALLMCCALLQGGCATKRDHVFMAALERASVADVTVEVAPGAGNDIVGLDGLTDREKAPAVAAKVESHLRARVLGLPGGGQAARMRVTLQRIWITSTATRVLGETSIISGTVRLEDMKTRDLIVDLGTFTGREITMKGAGIGVAVSLAVNTVMAVT